MTRKVRIPALRPNGRPIFVISIYRAEMNRKLTLKSPRFVTFDAYLAQLEVKPDTPGFDTLHFDLLLLLFLSRDFFPSF